LVVGVVMTYLLFINGVFWDSTRSSAQAFQWFDDWSDLGHSAGLKFASDEDGEAELWLIPQETRVAMQLAA